MEQLLICMSLSLIAGLLASRAAKAVRLPAVTSYLVAGLLLGPFFLGRLGLSGWGFGFGSLAQVESYGIITQVALGFIAFVIGNEFRLSALESMGRQAVTVGILQAVITTVLVDIALVALHFARPDVISMASAITLGSIASATAPAATLMVVKQYKASGSLTRLLLMVVAIDDAVGLVLFSASFGIANALEQGRIDPISILLEPLVEIVLSLGLGALAGLLLNQLEIYFHSRSKRMSLSVAFVLLTVGLSMVSFEVGPIHCSFSLLLVCMMTGTVFCNICPTSDELMDRLDRWVSPVNILFFVLSGAELDLNILANPMVLLIGAVYIASRSLGKISGSYVSCKATRCSEKIQKYLGITLLPQAGVALGMAAEAAELSDGHMVRNVVLFSHKRPYRQQPGGAGQCGLISPISLAAGNGAFLHYKSRCTVVTLCSGFLFALYFSTISSFSASTVRVEPETRVPSMIFSAAGSSTALRMVRRRSRAPNLPPWLLCTSAASAAGV